MRVKSKCKNKNKKKKKVHSLHSLHGLRFGVTEARVQGLE